MTARKKATAKPAKSENVSEPKVEIKIYFPAALVARATLEVARRKGEDRRASMSGLVTEALETYLARRR